MTISGLTDILQDKIFGLMVKFSGMPGNTYHCGEYQIYGKENAFFVVLRMWSRMAKETAYRCTSARIAAGNLGAVSTATSHKSQRTT